jgi:hypothetical protein
MKKLIIACLAAGALVSLSACSTSAPDRTVRYDEGPQNLLQPMVVTSDPDLIRSSGPP